jgi:hypothetical protein
MSRYNRPVLKNQIELKHQIEGKHHRPVELKIKLGQSSFDLLLVLKRVDVFHFPKRYNEFHFEDGKEHEVDE